MKFGVAVKANHSQFDIAEFLFKIDLGFVKPY